MINWLNAKLVLFSTFPIWPGEAAAALPTDPAAKGCNNDALAASALAYAPPAAVNARTNCA